jgi:hypothetical protein
MSREFNAVFSELIKRAKGDPAFRRSCLADPEGAFRNHAQLALPREARIWFVLALEGIDLKNAPEPDAEGVDISDAELENAVGGMSEGEMNTGAISEEEKHRIKAQWTRTHPGHR